MLSFSGVEDVIIFHDVNVIIFEGLGNIRVLRMLSFFRVLSFLLSFGYIIYFMLSFGVIIFLCYHLVLSFILCYHLMFSFFVIIYCYNFPLFSENVTLLAHFYMNLPQKSRHGFLMSPAEKNWWLSPAASVLIIYHTLGQQSPMMDIL